MHLHRASKKSHTHAGRRTQSIPVAELLVVSVFFVNGYTADGPGRLGRTPETARTGRMTLPFAWATDGGNRRISADVDGQTTGDGRRRENVTKHPLEAQKPHLEAMPKEGIEPSPCCQDGILNPARLPIPPLRQLVYKQALISTTGLSALPLAGPSPDIPNAHIIIHCLRKSTVHTLTPPTQCLGRPFAPIPAQSHYHT